MTLNTFYIYGGLLAYLIGSIPTAVWIGRLIYGIDIREHGSGNAGATNALRVLGKTVGFSVLILDFFKGFLAANLVYLLSTGTVQSGEAVIYSQLLFGALAVIGHVYPIFAKFKGGKGIATLLGLMVALSWQVALVCVVIFIVSVWISRYISVGSLLAATFSPIIAGLMYNWEQMILVWFCLVVALMVIYTHRANIKRLMAGNENRFTFKKKNN